MCGITGIYRFNKQVNPDEIDKLTDSLSHRGPDGRGVWFNNKKNLGLGHRRLSILDLTVAGTQPMVSPDGKYVIVLNGEIFNFLEIKSKLALKGYTFKTKTDTEVVLKAYQEWGTKMLDIFNGMWAFAIYDIDKEMLFLSRDRYGVKPLYYFYDNNEFVFASEVKSIYQYLGKRGTINKTTIQDILDFNQEYHGTERTYINEVKSLKAGHNLYLNCNGLQDENWYHFKKEKVPKDFNEQAKQLKELLIDAIKIRLRSDVPVGTCLSGGIDSGAISSLINTFNANDDKRFSNFSHHSFCAGFPDKNLDETKDAKRLANQLKIKLDVEMINTPSALKLEEALNQTDGPMPALAFYPIWQLYGYIKKQNITVTLDGQGADEMLGGYFLGFEALKGAMEKGDLFWFYDLKKTYAALNPSLNKTMQDFSKTVIKMKLLEIKNKGLKVFKSILSLKFKQIKTTNKLGNSFETALRKQFFSTPLPFLLHQYDRASMANGIECRMPFMDYRVVEFIFSLPSKSKVGSGYTKRVLREALKGILPNETRLNKEKTGFNAPTTEWFQDELKEWFYKQINSDTFVKNPYFDGLKMREDFLEKLNSNRASDYEWKYWPYIHLSYWMKQNNLIDQVE